MKFIKRSVLTLFSSFFLSNCSGNPQFARPADDETDKGVDYIRNVHFWRRELCEERGVHCFKVNAIGKVIPQLIVSDGILKEYITLSSNNSEEAQRKLREEMESVGPSELERSLVGESTESKPKGSNAPKGAKTKGSNTYFQVKFEGSNQEGGDNEPQLNASSPLKAICPSIPCHAVEAVVAGTVNTQDDSVFIRVILRDEGQFWGSATDANQATSWTITCPSPNMVPTFNELACNAMDEDCKCTIESEVNEDSVRVQMSTLDSVGGPGSVDCDSERGSIAEVEIVCKKED